MHTRTHAHTHTRTHTHTHACTHARTHARTHCSLMCVCVCVCVCACVRACVRVHPTLGFAEHTHMQQVRARTHTHTDYRKKLAHPPAIGEPTGSLRTGRLICAKTDRHTRTSLSLASAAARLCRTPAGACCRHAHTYARLHTYMRDRPSVHTRAPAAAAGLSQRVSEVAGL